MYPLGIFSVLIWGIVLERLGYYRRLVRRSAHFYQEVMPLLLRKQVPAVQHLCVDQQKLPLAALLLLALERLQSQDSDLKNTWLQAVERKRAAYQQEMKQFLWILGTLGSASPFVGLFGTVVGILKSFQEMARAGAGGFSVVAAGISESLVATAAGIVVAVIAVLAFNAFQTYVTQLNLKMRSQLEEMLELVVWMEALPQTSGQATIGAVRGA